MIVVSWMQKSKSFDGIIPALNAGKFDANMAGMSATPKREEVIAFSVPYGSTGQTFAVLKSGPVTALPEQGQVFSLESDEVGAMKAIDALKPVLEGKIIGVQTASIAASFVDKYLKGVVETREYKTTEQHDLDLAAGRVDLIMASMAYLSGIAGKPDFADIVIVGPRFQGGILGRGSSVGLRKSDPELKTMFDEAITAAKADGTIQRLSQRWFGYDVTPR
jgi:octopine/nopaline transport system substrate-binding protein